MRDEAAEKLLKEYPCDVGEEIAATVRLKVIGRREDEYEKSVSFEVIEIEDMTEESEGKDDEGETPEEVAEGDNDERVLGYRRKKKAKPEAPAASAQELTE